MDTETQKLIGAIESAIRAIARLNAELAKGAK
jgi:hypothetical protein